MSDSFNEHQTSTGTGSVGGATLEGQPSERSGRQALASQQRSDRAGPWLWAAAAAAYIFCLVIWSASPGQHERLTALELPELLGEITGIAIGLVLVSLLVVGVASLWKINRTPKRRVAICALTALALGAMDGMFILRLARGMNSGPPWHYESKEHGFTLTLPSARWKRATQQTHIADFWMPDAAPLLASVVSVKSQGLQQFDAFAASLRSAAQARTSTGAPRFDSGEMTGGNRYELASSIEDARSSRKLYSAQCLTYLAEKRTTVSMIFERHGMMFSEAGQATERSEFEGQIKAICSSVR